MEISIDALRERIETHRSSHSGKLILATYGLPGSGKSTLTRALFPGTCTISLDKCREWLTDDVGNQDANKYLGAVMASVLFARLEAGVAGTTVVDNTHLDPAYLQGLFTVTDRWAVPKVVLALDIEDGALAENLAARDRKIPDWAMARMKGQIRDWKHLVQQDFGAHGFQWIEVRVCPGNVYHLK
jgi:predicted kinase